MTFKQLTAATKFPRFDGMRVAHAGRFGTINGRAFGRFRVTFDGDTQFTYCSPNALDYQPEEPEPETATAALDNFAFSAQFPTSPDLHNALATLSGPALLHVDGKLIGEVINDPQGGNSYAAGLVALHRPRRNGSRLSNQLRGIEDLDTDFEPPHIEAATSAPPAKLLAPTLDGHMEALLDQFPTDEGPRTTDQPQ